MNSMWLSFLNVVLLAYGVAAEVVESFMLGHSLGTESDAARVERLVGARPRGIEVRTFLARIP